MEKRIDDKSHKASYNIFEDANETKENFFNILNECIPDTVQPEQIDDAAEEVGSRLAGSMLLDINEDPQYSVEACLNSVECDDSHIASVARIIFENMWTSLLDWDKSEY